MSFRKSKKIWVGSYVKYKKNTMRRSNNIYNSVSEDA
jgi:hypothetical protein